jgi:excinuclease ABC subunit C
MNYKAFQKLKLPEIPGVYFFKKGKKILYIGKATSLSSRVRSYFMKDLIATRGPLLVDMVFQADTISIQQTDSVLEALILEANLIKKYKPYYNTREKDDRSWNYIVITREVFPKILLIRGHELAKYKAGETIGLLENAKIAKLYGPYTQGLALREVLKIIRRIFPFIDRSSAKPDNYEFYRQLGLTPEITTIEAKETYKKNLKNISLLLEGKKQQILKSLRKDMMLYAKRQEFEKASKVKSQIFALEHIRDVSLIKEENTQEGNATKFRIEAYDIAHMSGKNMVGVMTVVTNGIADTSEYRKFIIRSQSGSNDTGALEEVLSRRLRHTEWGMPDLIVVDGGVAQKNVAEQVVARYQFPIPVVAVVKDDRHKPAKILYTNTDNLSSESLLNESLSDFTGKVNKKNSAGKAREILGEKTVFKNKDAAILLANSEAHRFGITFHKKKRSKNFLPS